MISRASLISAQARSLGSLRFTSCLFCTMALHQFDYDDMSSMRYGNMILMHDLQCPQLLPLTPCFDVIFPEIRDTS